MKKFLTLVLALVMALAIALPAMAFTSDTTEASTAVPFELDVYLVEYDNDEFFGITSLPPSDRGYAKNEVVAAIVELYIPKDENPKTEGYTVLDISGDNVTFNVTDRAIKGDKALAIADKTDKADGYTVDIAGATAASLDGKVTMKWLVFAKVTGEDASITAELVDGTAPKAPTAAGVVYTLDGVDYLIKKNSGSYSILVQEGDYAGAQITIDVDSKNKSTGMNIRATASSTEYPLGVTVGGTLGIIVGNVVKTSGSAFESVMDVYEDVVKDVFGLDYMLIGNYVRDSFWTGLVSGDTLTATVEIKPWTAYVTVPDNIVVDPPKTGDAASIVGFVMIVLAAAAVVAVKKVRA